MHFGSMAVFLLKQAKFEGVCIGSVIALGEHIGISPLPDYLRVLGAQVLKPGSPKRRGFLQQGFCCRARRSKKMRAIHLPLRYDVRRERALTITSVLLCV